MNKEAEPFPIHTSSSSVQRVHIAPMAKHELRFLYNWVRLYLTSCEKS